MHFEFIVIVHSVMLIVKGDVLLRSDTNTEEMVVEFSDVCGGIGFHTM